MHNMQRVPKKCPASVFHFLHLAFWFDPGCWDQKQQLDVAATTAAVLLLLCCCCCAAASAAPRSAIRRCSTVRDADPRCIYRDSRKKCSASVFHFLHLAFWFLTRGAGTKSSNFTLPQRVEESETSRDTGGNIVRRVEGRVPAKNDTEKFKRHGAML